MEKVLLFAILAISINAFSQSKQSILGLQHPSLYTLQDFQDKMRNGEEFTTGFLSKNNPAQGHKHQTLSQNSIIPLYDSVYNWQWDTLTMSWKINSKIINMVYNATNNLISEIGLNWSGSTWENSWKVIITYDANNNLTSTLYEDWNGSAWNESNKQIWTYDPNNNITSEISQFLNGSLMQNYYQRISTYDANNNRTSLTTQFWIGTAWQNSDRYVSTYNANNNNTVNLYQGWNGSDWVNGTQNIFTYDASNNQTSRLYQSWDINTWQSDTQDTFTYDGNNNLLTIVTQRRFIGSELQNAIKIIFTYDSSNNQTSILYQNWNSNWDNSSLRSFTYDVKNNMTSQLSQNWNGSNFENEYQDTFTYDDNNNQTSELSQTWNGNIWNINSQRLSFFDVDNFMLNYSYKYWDAGRNIVTYGDSTNNYFHTVLTGIKDLAGPDNSITVYPNPNSGNFNINSINPICGIEIYNPAGNRVYSDYKLKQQTSKEVDLSRSPKGIYLVKINNGTKKYVRKVVVE
jgi:hypothetical protein